MVFSNKEVAFSNIPEYNFRSGRGKRGMVEFYETTYDLTSKQNADMEGILFGQEDCAPRHSYGPTLRPYHLFHFVTRGQGSLQIDGVSYEIGAGDAFLIPAEQMAYYEASAREPWSYSWAGLTGLRAAQYIRQILAAAPERYVLRGLDTKKYAASIRKAAYLKGTSASNYFQSEIVLYELFAYLTEDLTALGRADEAPPLAARIKFYLDAKCTENLRLSEVAARFHIHPNHLSRVFHAQYGVSPKKYLLGLKLDRAENMLRTTALPVTLISASLGFEDQHTFSKLFKKERGVSPTDYRSSTRRAP